MKALDLSKWKPITFFELKNMSNEDQKQLLSYCWCDYSGDGNLKYRCETIGIWDMQIKIVDDMVKDVSWSDCDGDPHIDKSFKLSDSIHKITSDGEWYYGLYKRK